MASFHDDEHTDPSKCRKTPSKFLNITFRASRTCFFHFIHFEYKIFHKPHDPFKKRGSRAVRGRASGPRGAHRGSVRAGARFTKGAWHLFKVTSRRTCRRARRPRSGRDKSPRPWSATSSPAATPPTTSASGRWAAAVAPPSRPAARASAGTARSSRRRCPPGQWGLESGRRRRTRRPAARQTHCLRRRNRRPLEN
jgi:hypothetical protein